MESFLTSEYLLLANNDCSRDIIDDITMYSVYTIKVKEKDVGVANYVNVLTALFGLAQIYTSISCGSYLYTKLDSKYDFRYDFICQTGI